MKLLVHVQKLFLGAANSGNDDDPSLLSLELLHAANLDVRTKVFLLDHLLDLLNLQVRVKNNCKNVKNLEQ